MTRQAFDERLVLHCVAGHVGGFHVELHRHGHALAVHHGTIPPTAGFSSPNQALAGPAPFVVPRAPLPWTETGTIALPPFFDVTLTVAVGAVVVMSAAPAASIWAAGPTPATLRSVSGMVLSLDSACTCSLSVSASYSAEPVT